MRVRIEATPGELDQKATRLVETLAFRLQGAAPDLAEALTKALPRKEHSLKFRALREMNEIAQAEYERLMGAMLREIGDVLNDRGHSSSLDFVDDTEKSLDSDLGENEVWLDSLFKGAGHKYLKRWNNSSPPPKYSYAYDLTHDKTIAPYQVGDKVKIEHKGKAGHFEVLGEEKHEQSGERMLTVRHDETGHEMKVSEGFLHQLFAQTHRDPILAALNESYDAKFKGLPKEQTQKLEARAEKLKAIYDPGNLMPGHIRWGVLQEAHGWTVDRLKEFVTEATSPNFERNDPAYNRFHEISRWVGTLRQYVDHEASVARHDSDHPGHSAAKDAREDIKKVIDIWDEISHGWYRSQRGDRSKPTVTETWFERAAKASSPAQAKRVATQVRKRIDEMSELIGLALYNTNHVTNADREYMQIRFDRPVEETRASDAKVVVHYTAQMPGARPIADSLAQIRRTLADVQRAGFGEATKDLTIHLRGGKVKENPLSPFGTAGEYYPREMRSAEHEKKGDVMLHTIAFDGDRGSAPSDVLTHELGHRFFYRNLSGRAREAWTNEINQRSVKLSADQVQALRDAVLPESLRDANLPREWASINIRKMIDRLRESDVYGAKHAAEFFDSFHYRTPDTIDISWVHEIFKEMANHPMVTPFVSWYGGNNASEYFAEAFERYIDEGPRALPEWTRAFFDRVTKEGGLRKAFGDGPEPKDPSDEPEEPEEPVEPGEYNPDTDKMEPEPKDEDEDTEPEEEEDLSSSFAKAITDQERPGHKYVRRWRGKGGEWHYEYAEDKPSLPQGEAQQAKPIPEPQVELRSVPKADEGQIVADLSERPPWFLGELLERVKSEQQATAASKRGTPMHLYQWERLARAALEAQIVEQWAEQAAADPVPATAQAEKPRIPQQLGFSFTAMREHTPEPTPQEQAAAAVEPVDTAIEASPLHTDENAEPHEAEPDVDTDAVDQEPEPEPMAMEAEKPRTKRGKGSRRRHKEVGEHVEGSRKDLSFPRTSGELAALSVADQDRFVTKAKMLPEWNHEDLLGEGWDPGAILLRDGLEKCIGAKAPATLQGRQNYMDAIAFLTRSYDKVRTVADFENLLTEWHYLLVGFTPKVAAMPEQTAYEKRDAALRARGVTLPLTYHEYKLARMNLREMQRDMVDLMQSDPEKFRAKATTIQAMREKIANYENGNLSWDERQGLGRHCLGLIARDALGQSFQVVEHQDDTISISVSDQSLGSHFDTNPYAQMAAALGPRFVKAVGVQHGVALGPKPLTDAYKAAREMRKEPHETQVAQMAQLLGKKSQTIREKQFLWKRRFTGKAERVGGRPVVVPDEALLKKDFGFQNIQFGDWVTDDDADEHLSGAHGAFLDLADLLGEDDHTLSLNGRLSLSFGGRGIGGRYAGSAHYEHKGEIINLTKFAGGGCLAHEWAHAFDNILAKFVNPDEAHKKIYLSEGRYGATHPEIVAAYRRVMGRAMWADQETAKKADRLLELDQKFAKDRRSESRDERLELARLRGQSVGWKRSGMFARSARLTKGMRGEMVEPFEIFARVFETWAEAKLADQGRANAYLARGTDEEAGRETAAAKAAFDQMLGREPSKDPFEGHPYPVGDERRELVGLMDELLATLQKHAALKKALDWLDEQDALRKAHAEITAGDGDELMTCEEFFATASALEEIRDPERDDADMSEIAVELEKATEGQERPGHKYIRRYRGPSGEWQYEYEEPAKPSGVPSAPKAGPEDPGERWADAEAKAWLERVGDQLYEHQMMDPTTKDETGFNSFDLHRWQGVRGNIHAMRVMLKKYKRQIGGEDYYRAGCADRQSAYRMEFSIHPRFGSLNMTLSGRLERGDWENLYNNILKPAGWFYSTTDKVYVLKREYLHKVKDPTAFLEKLADALPKEMEFGEWPKALLQSPEEAKRTQEQETKSALERAKESGKSPVDGVFEALRRGTLKNVVAMRWHPEDGSFEFRQSADKTVSQIFKNDSGILKGIVFWDPKGIERGTWERYVFDLNVAKQAIEEIRKRAPDWQIVTEGLEEAERQEQERQATLQKPIPEVAEKLAPGYALYPYQNEGVRFLQKTNGRALIGDEMGLGKTIQCLGYIVAEKKRAIAVVPKNVRRNWVEESQRFFPGGVIPAIELDSSALLKITRQVDKELPGADAAAKKAAIRQRLGLDTAHLATINYESIDKFLPYIEGSGFDTLVVDESHRMKNPKAKVTKAIKSLADDMAHRILLSGTAIKNRRGELFEQIDLVRPGLFHSAKDIMSTTIGGTVKKMREVYLHRSKKEVLQDLPEKRNSIVNQEVEHAPDLATSPAKFVQNAGYFARAEAIEAGKTDAEADAEATRAEEAAKAEIEEMRLSMDDREFADFFRKRSITEYTRIKFALAQAKVPATYDFVNDVLEGSDSNVLIFTESKGAARKLHEKFGPELSLIHTGDESYEKKEKVKKLFNARQRPEDTTQRVLILTTPSAREGITLTAADKVIFNDLPWTASDIAQAEARAHRIGQEKEVDVYWMAAADNSMDQAITDLIRQKYRLHALVNEQRPVTDAEKKWQEEKLKISDIVDKLMGRDPQGIVKPMVETKEGPQGEPVTVTTINPTPAPDVVQPEAPTKPKRQAVKRKTPEKVAEAPTVEVKPEPEKPARHKFDTSDRTYSQEDMAIAARYHNTAAQHLDDFPPALRDRARALHKEAEGNPLGTSWQDLTPAQARKVAREGFGGKGDLRDEAIYRETTAGGSLIMRRQPSPSTDWRLYYTSQVAPVSDAMQTPSPEAHKPEATKPVQRRAVKRKEPSAETKQMQLELFKALIKSIGAHAAVALLEDAQADEFFDWTKPIADADGWAYERMKDILGPYGYGPGDYEVGGRLYGMSLNELLDLARALRQVD